jgi:hypothetical protein
VCLYSRRLRTARLSVHIISIIGYLLPLERFHTQVPVFPFRIHKYIRVIKSAAQKEIIAPRLPSDIPLASNNQADGPQVHSWPKRLHCTSRRGFEEVNDVLNETRQQQQINRPAPQICPATNVSEVAVQAVSRKSFISSKLFAASTVIAQ